MQPGQMQPGIPPQGMQPNIAGPMPPQGMQPGQMQPGIPPQGMQPNIAGPMPPQGMQPGIPPQGMQPNIAGPRPPQGMQPGGPGAMMPAPSPMQSSPVIPMQSSGQWRGDPNASPQAFPQGNNQPWQGGPQEAVGAPHPPHMPQQPAPPAYNNQQRPANPQRQPPPQIQRPSTPLPYNNSVPMQQGRGTPPPQGNIPSQPLIPNQRFAPTPQYSPELPHTPALSQPIANPQYPPAQPQHTPPIANPQPATGLPKAPTNGQSATAGPGVPMAHIFVEIDGKIIQECRLDKPALTVGRQDARDIQIKHQSVSRTHAKILFENGIWHVEDAGSVNGIVFNGQRVSRTAVNNGDRVYIAPNIALIFKMA